VARCLADVIIRQALPAELGIVVDAALHQPRKLLTLPAITHAGPLRRVDGGTWPLHVILMHAATSHGDRPDCSPTEWERAVPVAAAVELLGAALDIFDDVQDGDSPLTETYGMPMMINAALALRELAHVALADSRIPVALHPLLHQAFASDTLRAVGGQTLDVAFEQRIHVTMDAAITMTERKSGSLVGLVYRVGALLGLYDTGATEERLRMQSERYAEFGRTLGVVIQLENDWNDSWGEAMSLKSDRARGKKTLPLVIETEKMPPALSPEERRAFVFRMVQTVISLYRLRAHRQLDALVTDDHVSPRWLHWLVNE